jgi:hypothetical protein
MHETTGTSLCPESMADIPSNSPQPHAGGLLLLSVDHSPHSSWGGRIVLIGSVNEDCRMPLTCLTQNRMSAAAPQAIRGQEMWSTYVKMMVFSTPPVRGWFGLRPTRYAETMPMPRHECAQRGECCGSEYSCRPGISIMLSNWVMTNLGMPCPAITIHGLTYVALPDDSAFWMRLGWKSFVDTIDTWIVRVAIMCCPRSIPMCDHHVS